MIALGPLRLLQSSKFYLIQAHKAFVGSGADHSGTGSSSDCRLLRIFLLLVSVSAALMHSTRADEPIVDSPISVSWGLISNFTNKPNGFEARLTLTNNGTEPLTDSGWGLFFNMAPRPIVQHPVTQPARVQHINGDWYRLLPDPGFLLSPGSTMEIRYMGNEPVIKESDAPLGLYFAFQDKPTDQPRIEVVSDYSILPFTSPEQILRGPDDHIPLPTPQRRYLENQSVSLLPSEQTPLLVPSPLAIQRRKGTAVLMAGWKIQFESGLEESSAYLAQELLSRFGLELTVEKYSHRQDKALTDTISLRRNPDLVGHVSKEAYSLEVSENSVEIAGSDTAGVFYGIQSLLNLFPVDAFEKRESQIALPTVSVKDSPRFGYRGLHIDVSRNFQTKETIQRIMAVMAMYKLNRLLLYTTEDEGWRIEIPGLPELTSVGGQRQHNSGKEHPSLHPAYGSGPVAKAVGSNGSGFYTRSEFIELLKYAAQRNIKVIPEVNFPGHARAAIKAMEARYERLMAEGKPEAAEEYRLVDPLDVSEYRSAQAYLDNVVSVARPSTYKFYHKVLDELSAMYTEAGLRLDEIHTGGDEVPAGSWTKSPMAAKLLAEQPDIGSVDNMQTYFFRRLLSDLEKRGITALGWEEVFQQKNAEGKVEPNPEFVGRDVVAYIWNNLFDYDLGNRLANIGYPVILCNVSNFYFDLAYDNDPREPGLYWAGFVNEKDSFLFAPFNYMVTTFRTSMGKPIDIDVIESTYKKLNPSAYKNIRGVQAQLWSETIKGRDMIEYYMLPKLIGFSESAWAAERPWETIADRSARELSMAKAWNVMANCIGQRELPRLAYLNGGYNYRVPPPGGVIKEGKLVANVSLPGLTVRYTLDGTDPTIESQVYTQPVPVGGDARLRAFDLSGRASRVIPIQFE